MFGGGYDSGRIITKRRGEVKMKEDREMFFVESSPKKYFLDSTPPFL
jgi:hypothetical protein